MADPRDPRRFDPFPWLGARETMPQDVYYRPRLSRPGAGAGRTTAAEGQAEQAYMARPPWLDPPALHFPFDVPQNRIPVVVPAAGSLVIVLAPIPQGMTGTVRRIGVSSSDFANTRVTTRINTTPVPPLAGIVGTVWDFNNPPELPGVILLRAGDQFNLLIENLGGVGVTIGARFAGWWW